MSMYKNLTTVAAVAALAFGLAACGGGGGGDDDQTMMQCPAGQIGTYPDCSDPPTTYETAKANIAAAETAEAAQEAYDAVKDDVTAAEGEMLQAAVDARIMAINTAARVDEQKMALSDAAGMIDTSDLSTQELVDAANDAIRDLRQALEDAVDVSDAVGDVDEAQGGINTATRRTNQMTALSEASDDLQDALAALSGSTPTQALLDDANTALTALNTAITDGADLTDTEKAPYQREADNAAAPIQMAQTAFDDAEKTANAAMAVTAAKLHAGISAQMGDGDLTNLEANDRDAGYNATGTAILVSIGSETAAATAAITLSEDKDTTVAAHHGWEGKRYTASPTGGGTYEAVVYSNVGEPTMGAKFNSGADAGNVGFATVDGVLTIDGSTNTANRISSPSFDHAAGYKTFKLPESNPQGATNITIPGSYYGVAGTYACNPTDNDNGCRVTKASDGYTLVLTGDGGGAWTFTATNPEARVTSMPDGDYASYGWWIHKSADDKTYTASAFVDDKGADPTALAGIHGTLNGTATYMGGAAGKYALSSSTGGTNDAGHFTARATLEADFNDDTITGTIDNFMGADNMSRNWSVELKEAGLSDDGAIGSGTAADNSAITMAETVWTIDEDAAEASGQWSGQLQEAGTDDGVPQVATGTFYSTYGDDGKMVGAFGVNKQ